MGILPVGDGGANGRQDDAKPERAELGRRMFQRLVAGPEEQTAANASGMETQEVKVHKQQQQQQQWQQQWQQQHQQQQQQQQATQQSLAKDQQVRVPQQLFLV